ncbi:MAG: hypothetical protein A2X25_12120 [Chloroflexi bacterium GWB2_49_20]|nr:MAG: hypothetical protein A2X25_12120 [Chloroflexi bacterium GWB2_49_20]OGN77747.1 MAG: hypothetical protein A2X26_10390 [Chloroflexi bacterium GWC2_49_37]OGN86522.1 MAG: hypothetical protein A2X27_06545 [Chloroflexi bacterium GWD2_49_16]HBG74775.1 hypothetical protein [Anaerolineae bacterium]
MLFVEIPVCKENLPFWERPYLDVNLLTAATVVLIITQLNCKVYPTSNEGVALSLSFYIFLAPFFARTGMTLFTLTLLNHGLVASA